MLSPLSPLRSKGPSGLRHKDLQGRIGDRRCCPIAVPDPQNQCRRNVLLIQERAGNLAPTASVDVVARRRAARPTAAVQSQRCGAAERNFPTLQPVVRSDHGMPLSGWLWPTLRRRHAGHTRQLPRRNSPLKPPGIGHMIRQTPINGRHAHRSCRSQKKPARLSGLCKARPLLL